MTDEWQAYNQLPALGYQHLTVNHSLNFVNPVTLANTQRIESNWRPLKKHICRGGLKKANLGYQVAEYLWRREVERQGVDPFIAIVRAIARQYPGF